MTLRMATKISQAVGTEQGSLFHESIYEALRATVGGLGGTKAIAQTLFPEKSVDDAARYLLDCLNPDRPAELKPERVVLLLKIARAKGIHTGMSFISGEAGYACQPIEPEDELAELQRQFISAAEAMRKLAERIERTESKITPLAVRR